MNGLVIGVMTGTSLDAIDIALLQIKKIYLLNLSTSIAKRFLKS